MAAALTEEHPVSVEDRHQPIFENRLTSIFSTPGCLRAPVRLSMTGRPYGRPVNQ
jgi:hypothetical protein